VHQNAANLLEAAAKLHLVDIYFGEMTDRICKVTGLSPGSLQGPQGHVSCSVRSSVRSAITSIPRIVSNLLSEVR
jgi:hypothetical protein